MNRTVVSQLVPPWFIVGLAWLVTASFRLGLIMSAAVLAGYAFTPSRPQMIVGLLLGACAALLVSAAIDAAIARMLCPTSSCACRGVRSAFLGRALDCYSVRRGVRQFPRRFELLRRCELALIGAFLAMLVMRLFDDDVRPLAQVPELARESDRKARESAELFGAANITLLAVVAVATCVSLSLFSRAVRLQRERHRDAWVADGCPRAPWEVPWRLPSAGDTSMPTGLTDVSRANRLLLVWLIRTPAWAADDAEVRRLLWIMRASQCAALTSIAWWWLRI